jgi:isoleucyl-tRNA synthetase
VKVLNDSEGETVESMKDQLLEELNVKGLEVIDDDAEFFEYQIKPNLPLLGPKYGNQVGAIQRVLGQADKAEVARAATTGRPVALDGFVLQANELLVSISGKPGYAVAEEAGYAVAVTTEITQELADEGLARELVRRVQEMRKSAGFDIADHIAVYWQGDPDFERVLGAHGDYIRQETLAESITPARPEGLEGRGAYTEEHDIDGRKLMLAVARL